MAEEQKTWGVPDGWRIHHVEISRAAFEGNAAAGTVYLERIPKPKQRVLHAKFMVPEKACTGIYPIVTAEFQMQDDSRETVRDWTPSIEERDATEEHKIEESTSNGLLMKYFVLKPRGSDPFARASRAALRAYAKAILYTNSALGHDLREWADRESRAPLVERDA